MGVLYLVRHGKASDLTEGHYDSLSPTGWQQSQALGNYWKAQQRRFDQVFVGPRRRHEETLDGAFRAVGYPATHVQRIDELDEHAGLLVVKNAEPSWLSMQPEAVDIAARIAANQATREDRLFAFRVVVRAWVAGTLTVDRVETWRAFQDRVSTGFGRMLAFCEGKNSCVAFTSAGTIAAIVGSVLGLTDKVVLDLSWRLYNASVTELVVGREGVSMRTFNETAHLFDRELLTQV